MPFYYSHTTDSRFTKWLKVALNAILVTILFAIIFFCATIETPQPPYVVSEDEIEETNEYHLGVLLNKWKRAVIENGPAGIKKRADETRKNPLYSNGYYFAVAIRPTEKTDEVQIVVYGDRSTNVIAESGFVGSELSKSEIVKFK